MKLNKLQLIVAVENAAKTPSEPWVLGDYDFVAIKALGWDGGWVLAYKDRETQSVGGYWFMKLDRSVTHLSYEEGEPNYISRFTLVEGGLEDDGYAAFRKAYEAGLEILAEDEEVEEHLVAQSMSFWEKVVTAWFIEMNQEKSSAIRGWMTYGTDGGALNRMSHKGYDISLGYTDGCVINVSYLRRRAEATISKTSCTWTRLYDNNIVVAVRLDCEDQIRAYVGEQMADGLSNVMSWVTIPDSLLTTVCPAAKALGLVKDEDVKRLNEDAVMQMIADLALLQDDAELGADWLTMLETTELIRQARNMVLDGQPTRHSRNMHRMDAAICKRSVVDPATDPIDEELLRAFGLVE